MSTTTIKLTKSIGSMLLLLISLWISMESCKKKAVLEDGPEESQLQEQDYDNRFSYRFSSPEFLVSTDAGLYSELAGLTYRFNEDFIIRMSTYPRYSGSSIDVSLRNSSTGVTVKEIGYNFVDFDGMEYLKNTCFVMDESNQFIYALIYGGRFGDFLAGGLYRLNLNESKDIQLLADLSMVGMVNHIHLGKQGQLLISSRLYNGSLLQISAIDGKVTTLLDNLKNPFVFTEYGGDVYVTTNEVSTGGVLRLKANGTTEWILDNINKPSNIVFDNYGNFVLQFEKTLVGELLWTYRLYTADGQFITELTDNNQKEVMGPVSAPLSTRVHLYLHAPLYVDKNNNLVFFQRNDLNYKYKNPAAQGGYAFWKITMTKE